MENIPRRQTLISQTTAFLRAKIAAGYWQKRLPGERVLTGQLQVSRNTLRGALAQLRKEGVIHPVHGSGTEIIAPQQRGAATLQSRDVALLSPDPLERLQPRQTLFIDELRGLMSERGCRLRIFHGRRFFQPHPEANLEKLVADEPHGCWVLVTANNRVQSWFQKKRLPCVISGSTYPGIELPFADGDHRAICRHAVGVLARHGHTRIAYIAANVDRAGDLEGLEGFREGVRDCKRTEIASQVVFHRCTAASISLVLRRLMGQAERPTALLVANAFYFLAVASQLSKMGCRIPEDISLICRDESAFLNFFIPSPARYVVSPHLIARNLWRPVLELLEGSTVTKRNGFIMPDFIAGDSLGPPAAARHPAPGV